VTTRKLPPPRWQTPLPEGVTDSWGPEVAEYASVMLGIELDTWQRRALNRALATHPPDPGEVKGKLVHRVYLISVPRQNGKTAAVRALVGWALTNVEGPPWQMIVGLAYNRRQAGIPYRAVLKDLRREAKRVGKAESGGLSLTRYLGIRSGMYGRDREYNVFSREAQDAIRGESNDLALFDEVRTQRDDETWAGLEPTMTTSPQPLILETSTAGTDRSVLLRDQWERGLRIIEGAEPAEGFGMTWYAAPDDMAPDDRRAWRIASPSLAEERQNPATIAASYRSLSPSAFRMERLNLWSDAVDEWLPAGTWRDTIGSEPERTAARVVLAVEASPTWHRATVSVAVAGPGGAWTALAGEITAVQALTQTVSPAAAVELLAAAVEEWRPAAVAYNAAAAVGAHVEAWCVGKDLPTVKLGARELMAASELFRSELIGRRLKHADDTTLARQARMARPSRAIEGGGWYLSVRASLGDVDAIRASAWASWAAIAPPEPDTPLQVFL
jgi:hypothetical protein